MSHSCPLAFSVEDVLVEDFLVEDPPVDDVPVEDFRTRASCRTDLL